MENPLAKMEENNLYALTIQYLGDITVHYQKGFFEGSIKRVIYRANIGTR